MSSILALETSTDYCSVALSRGDREFVRSVQAGQSHSERVLSMVRAVLDDGAISLSGCDAVAFGAGPGSFTGLRIACAVAQGLAYGADLPLLPIGGLAAMAEEVRFESGASEALPVGATVLSALDARIGEIYWSLLEWTGSDWAERCPPALDRPADLAPRLIEQGLERASWGCGNAFRIFRTELAPRVDSIAGVEVAGARAIARLAARALERDGFEAASYSAQAAAPIYVRNRIALTTDERAVGSARSSAVPSPAAAAFNERTTLP